MIELMVVVVVVGVLLSIAIFNFRAMTLRLDVERETKEVFADLMNSRLKSMERNRARFVLLALPGSYRIVEDANNNNLPDQPPDSTVLPDKSMKYPMAWTGAGNQITFNRRGMVVAGQTGILRISNPPITATVDCVEIAPTRINLGKWNGAACEQR